MKIEYKLSKNDFLDYYLFFASENKKSKKAMKILHIIFSLMLISKTINSIFENDLFLSISFGILSVIVLFFFKKTYKTLISRNLTKTVEKSHYDRVGKKETLELSSDFIKLNFNSGESKIDITSIKQIDETDNHFFIKLNESSSFILPKREITNIEELKQKFNDLDLRVVDKLNWKW